ncbi:hypothetical protein C8R46DRAFT_48249 [Mycena filopes]|nr:hypothetical protein C8R46DRAFT_48249 [Mycena filopes]
MSECATAKLGRSCRRELWQAHQALMIRCRLIPLSLDVHVLACAFARLLCSGTRRLFSGPNSQSPRAPGSHWSHRLSRRNALLKSSPINYSTADRPCWRPQQVAAALYTVKVIETSHNNISYCLVYSSTNERTFNSFCIIAGRSRSQSRVSKPVAIGRPSGGLEEQAVYCSMNHPRALRQAAVGWCEATDAQHSEFQARSKITMAPPSAAHRGRTPYGESIQH